MFRHFFHYKFSKQITVAIIIFSLINLLLIIFYLERRIILFGMIMSVFTGIYFAGVYFTGSRKSLVLQKEIFVALVYSIGIWGGPVALKGFHFSSHQILFLIVFFLIALSDLLTFSFYEEKNDRLDEQNTFVINFGRKRTIRLVNILAAIVFIICVYQFENSTELLYRKVVLILTFMMFVILVLLYFQDFFKSRLLYRYIGELVFWLPALILFV